MYDSKYRKFPVFKWETSTNKCTLRAIPIVVSLMGNDTIIRTSDLLSKIDDCIEVIKLKVHDPSVVEFIKN